MFNNFSPLFLVRLKFKLSEVWSPTYEHADTPQFKEECSKISKSIEGLYEREKKTDSNRIEAHVTEIR